MSNQKPTYEDMYGSEYFRPEDLPKAGIRVKFVRADVRELRCTDSKKWKVCLFAQTTDGKPVKKLIAVNKTSAKQLCVVWGKPVDDTYSIWLGKLADLTHVKIKAFGKLADAVLITPVIQAVEDGGEFASASAEPPIIDAALAQPQSGIRRPQKKTGPEPAPAPVSQEPKQDVVDENTGEVLEPNEEPLDEIIINDIKDNDKTKREGAKTYWFIYGSDGKIYSTADCNIAGLADEAMALKRGVIIRADVGVKNSKGVEYFPIIELK